MASRKAKGTIALIVLAIVAGGLLLGVLGGSLVDPTMQRKGEGIGGKDPNAAANARRLEAQEKAGDLFDPFAEQRSGYRPDLDYEDERFGTAEDDADDADDAGDPDDTAGSSRRDEPDAGPIPILPPAMREPPAPRQPVRQPARPAPAQAPPSEPSGEDDLPPIY